MRIFSAENKALDCTGSGK
uniref:Uncharacterized protein n=1 Tax=Anguilla anguilla TaxID=7936 RepID=A0A0E9T9V8_ANGAN